MSSRVISESRRRLHPKESHATPVRRTGGSPASIQVSVSLAHWMELGATGKGGTPIRVLGEPAQTVTGSVGRVTFYVTRRFPHGRLRKTQEYLEFAQVTTTRYRAVSVPLSFRYVSYLTKLTTGEGW
ncbi:hypothetical protein MSTO_48520 [Mycobacterium stomatepiae]|uniref:Uncharacterized protein n=1 Tax=Mycobacterium stomatepiae TaxID=470076 RepID=A0A7I7QF11_9MYCO|nr:hypothetical protein MSTO_48520 [Mycobacterium stomatepiae]